MKLGLAALIDALNVRTALQRDKLSTSKWLRHHASVKRKLPEDYNDDVDSSSSSVIGALLNAVTSRTQIGGGSNEQNHSGNDASPSTTNVEGSQTKTPERTEPAEDSTSNGSQDGSKSQDARSSIKVEVSGSQVNPGASSGNTNGISNSSSGNSGSSNTTDWKRWAALAALLTGAGAGLGGGAALLNSYFGRNDTTIIESEEGLYPLLDWLEENRYHLKEE